MEGNKRSRDSEDETLYKQKLKRIEKDHKDNKDHRRIANKEVTINIMQ